MLLEAWDGLSPGMTSIETSGEYFQQAFPIKGPAPVPMGADKQVDSLVWKIAPLVTGEARVGASVAAGLHCHLVVGMFSEVLK